MTQDILNKLLIQSIPALSTQAQHYTETIEDAEDLLQDTLLLIIEKQEQYNDYNFGGWAYTLLTHLHLNHTRCKKTIHYTCRTIPDSTYTYEYNDINYIIEHLAPPFHDAIKLYSQGYKYHEIANLLHIPIGTVKSRINRARNQLLRLLSE